MIIDLEMDYEINAMGVKLIEILQLSKKRSGRICRIRKEKIENNKVDFFLAVITVLSLIILLYFLVTLMLKLIKARNMLRKEVQISMDMDNIEGKGSLQSLDNESQPES